MIMFDVCINRTRYNYTSILNIHGIKEMHYVLLGAFTKSTYLNV